MRVKRPATGSRSGARARRSLSLRTRLLVGLIALTAVFFVVMGVVTAVVLGTLESNQLNAEVRLASRQSLPLLAAGAGGFSAVYLSLDDGRAGTLTARSPTSAALRTLVVSLSGLTPEQAADRLEKLAPAGAPFSVTESGLPTVRAAWHILPSGATATDRRSSRPAPPSCSSARPPAR